MKIRGKNFTANQKKLLSKRYGDEYISKYLFKSSIILPYDDNIEHLNPECDKVEFWELISKETGDTTRLKIRNI
jgi:hypothetical protein